MSRSLTCKQIILFDMRFPTYIKLSVKFQYSSGWYCHCSVAKSCPTLCDPIYCSMPDFPVLHYLLEFAQIHVHWVGDAIQSFHSLSSPSFPALDLSQHQGLFQWVDSSHQVAKYWNFSFIDWGIDLFYCDVKCFALEMNWDHSVVFEVASKYCILGSFVDYEGCSISSKGFLPTVVGLMVI